MNKLIKTNQLITYLSFFILAAGAGFRLFHFFHNRSLWMDEIYLSSSLLHMSYHDLAVLPLDYQQKAPILFLWSVKLVLNTFGNSEMTLRFIPLLASLISLIIYYKVCKYFLDSWGQIIALSIFCFSPALIYHSVEIKQYAVESLATIIALYLFISYKDKIAWKSKIIWGIFGAFILWFSYASIFVFAGIAIGLSFYYLLKKEWRLLFTNLVPFLIWFVSFIINYLLFTHKHAESAWIVYWFKAYDNFMPLIPVSIHELKWFPVNLYQMMDYPLGLVWNFKKIADNFIVDAIKIPFIPVLLLVTGLNFLYKKDRKLCYIFLSVIAFTLIASGLYLYPLTERFWVFIAPIFILLIAFGFEYYSQKISSLKFRLLISIILILSPLSQSVYFLLWPAEFYKNKKSFQRESLLYIQKNYKKGDAVYVYWNDLPGYKVYKQIFNLSFEAIQGRDYRSSSTDFKSYNQQLQNDFIKFKGKKRLWLVYNTQFLTDIGDQIDEPKWYYEGEKKGISNLLSEFYKQGKPLNKIVTSDVTICLFSLNNLKQKATSAD